MNRVYQVYKGLQDAGRDILLPAPPLAPSGDGGVANQPGGGGGADPNNFRHGVLDRPDPHKVEDRVKLLAQIEMDAQLQEIRQKQIEEQKQRVLAKPNFGNLDPGQVGNGIKKGVSSEIVPHVAKNSGDPLISGGQDKDPEAQSRRDTVKAVRTFSYFGLGIGFQRIANECECGAKVF